MLLLALLFAVIKDSNFAFVDFELNISSPAFTTYRICMLRTRSKLLVLNVEPQLNKSPSEYHSTE